MPLPRPIGWASPWWLLPIVTVTLMRSIMPSLRSYRQLIASIMANAALEGKRPRYNGEAVESA